MSAATESVNPATPGRAAGQATNQAAGRAVAEPRKKYSRTKRSPLASVAIHATLIAASFIAIFPIVWVALTSLKTKDGQWAHPGDFSHLNFGNYSQVLNDTDFLTWFRNSLIVSLGTMALAVFIAATCGYAVSRMRFPGFRATMWLLLVVQMFPIAVLIVPLYNIMSKLHLVNSFGGLILVYCTTAVPYCAWMLKGYFDTIPIDIDEAGKVDGLSPFGTFWRLVLPLARPGLAVTAFYSFLTAWAEVAFANTFMQSSDKYTLAVGLRTFVSQYKGEWGLMTAASVLIAIPAGVMFLLVQRNLVAGLTSGSAKG
ncbi:arabinogalactan oligomer/maltooligosaccharide transport system permease protein [Catenulispora sp. GAS73]|uniref:sugar ABC transporter permease n=1 Tax=Catenulispora sp. GAS73 TaxID=3156269 RepID=UPI003512E29E